MTKPTKVKRAFLFGLGTGLVLGLAVAAIVPHSHHSSMASVPSVTPSAPTSAESFSPLTPTPTVLPLTRRPTPLLRVATSPSPTPLPLAEASQTLTYSIQPGDSLWAIAARFSTTVQSLAELNQLKTETIFPGQELIIPSSDSSGCTPTPLLPEMSALSSSPPDVSNGGVAWQPSILEGDLVSAYPAALEQDRFTLHYTPGTYPARDPQAIADMVARALAHIERKLAAHLNGHFDVYVAGSLFAPPDQALRGRSFSAARRVFFLYDGTGSPADQQYIITHELTHLFSWNVSGRPSSAMLSEGVAVYTGMTSIAGSHHVPIGVFCKAYYQAGKLPRVSTSLSFEGHIRDLANYYAAGCFVQYLIGAYGPEKFAQVYPTSDFINVYGKHLTALEEEWHAHLGTDDVSVPFEPDALISAVEAVSAAYDRLFSDFTGTATDLAAYLELDAARIALMEGRFSDVATHLAAFEKCMR